MGIESHFFLKKNVIKDWISSALATAVGFVMEATTGGVPSKKLLLKILHYSQESTFISLFFNKVAGLRSVTSLKKRLWQWHFLWILQNSKKIFFAEHLLEPASVFKSSITINDGIRKNEVLVR